MSSISYLFIYIWKLQQSTNVKMVLEKWFKYICSDQQNHTLVFIKVNFIVYLCYIADLSGTIIMDGLVLSLSYYKVC